MTYVKNDERVLYLACPEENCRKKVVDNDGIVDGLDNCPSVSNPTQDRL